MAIKAKYTVNSKCQLEFEGKDVKDMFQKLSHIGDVFGQGRCGNCESDNVQMQHRQPSGFDYYSVVCKDCRHEFKFGQMKDSGKLFPKGQWEPPYDGEGKKRREDRDESGDGYEYEPAGAGAEESDGF